MPNGKRVPLCVLINGGILKYVKKRIAIFDGDSIKHVVASASEKRSIKVTYIPTGSVREFNTRSEFYGRGKKKDAGWLGDLNARRVENAKEPFALDKFSIEDVQTAEPVENCLHSVKMYIKRLLTKLDCTEYIIYLGEGDVFRHNIPMPVGRRYKQNRENNLRALLLPEVDDYIMKFHNGVKIRDIEVDDKLAMIAWKGFMAYQATGDMEDDPYIIVARDKDQGGCNGRWFNPDYMEEPLYVEGFGNLTVDAKGKVRGTGFKFKCFQILFEDVADHYSGRRTPLAITDPEYDADSMIGTTKLNKYGERAVYNDLNPLTTEKECWELIVRKYREWMPEPITYTSWSGDNITVSWIEWLQYHIDFVHMRRWEGDRLIIEDICKEHGVNMDVSIKV